MTLKDGRRRYGRTSFSDRLSIGHGLSVCACDSLCHGKSRALCFAASLTGSEAPFVSASFCAWGSPRMSLSIGNGVCSALEDVTWLTWAVTVFFEVLSGVRAGLVNLVSVGVGLVDREGDCADRGDGHDGSDESSGKMHC